MTRQTPAQALIEAARAETALIYAGPVRDPRPIAQQIEDAERGPGRLDALCAALDQRLTPRPALRIVPTAEVA